MRASRGLYGSPARAKMGSFCDSTRVLKMSIIGMPVRTMFFGMMRLAGFTEGPPMSIMLSSRTGPLSRGTPPPVKTRPRRSSEKGTRMGCERNRTWASVATPLAPANTCNETSSSCRRMTWAREVPVRDVTSASSLYFTPVARMVMTLPEMFSTR